MKTQAKPIAEIKFHTSVYLTKKAHDKLILICGSSENDKFGRSKSNVICEAIEYLYETKYK
jgi:hypothetical protein